MFVLPLSLVALALWLGGTLRTPAPESGSDWNRFRVAVGLGLLAATMAAVAGFAPTEARNPVWVGLVAGAWAVALGSIRPNPSASLGLATAAIGLPALMPQLTTPTTGWATVVALALGAWVVHTPGLVVATVAALGIHVLNQLGSLAKGPEALPQAGLMLGLLAAIFAVLTQSWKHALRGPLVVASMAAASGWVATSVLKLPSGLILAGVGGLAGIMVLLLLAEGEPDSSVRVGLAAIITVAAATVGFSEGRGLGVALVAMVALSGATSAGSVRAVATLSPLLMLAVYRVFREEFTDATRAFDIGQHYAMIALLLGILAPLALAEAIPNRKGWKADLATGVSALLGLALPTMTSVLFGAKGVVGWMVGLSLAGIFSLGRPPERPELRWRTVALATGLSAVTIGTYSWSGAINNIGRTEKMQLLTTLIGVLATGAIVLTALSIEKKPSEEASS